MHHRLLVPGLVKSKLVRVLVKCLSDSRHVAVSEDPEHAPEERLLHAIP